MAYNMNYQQFINKPQAIKMRIEHQIEDVNYRWNICQNITACLHERVQTSPTNSRDKSYLNYIEAKRKLDDMYDEYNVACNSVREFLYENLDFDSADMLEWKYIEGKTLKEIAKIKRLTYESTKNKIWKADRKSENCYNNYSK